MTDLFRHSAELINPDSAQGHAYHIAKNINAKVESSWHLRNIIETNGLITAASNVIRLTNIKELNDKEKLIAGFLAERVNLNRTAVNFWNELDFKPKQVKLLIARTLAKLGETDEALELISEFENDTDNGVIRTIGFILSKAGLHEIALSHYQKHLSDENHELFCLAGISALRSGELDTATACLISCAENVTQLHVRLRAIKALGAIGHLTENDELLQQAMKLLRNGSSELEKKLRLELETRLDLVLGRIKAWGLSSLC